MGETMEFARECCMQTVGRVCVQLGFESAEEAALEAVADVIRSFVSALAKRTHGNMVHSQRTVVALNDVLAAFRQAPSARVSWRSLERFAFRTDGKGWNLPSHLVVPVLPASKRQRVVCTPNHIGTNDEERSSHIPKFLPPFPPAHTYRKPEPSYAIQQPDDDDDDDDPNAATVVREREALQIALNRISRTAANGGNPPTEPRRAGTSPEQPLVVADDDVA
ncbi:hypothetical protein CTAYLR_009846 [Chrysophaeum taylorii]|uniref:Transcription initiation factor TFIID subunit 8 n=1 Tax=Chrysophaeum taylorii TaxID=2483200 RepID=A0AAD7XI21_9STRA|nr:hypothetical protein CTAYLR_009846 [Chrysophaeum taylorii]